ncbi:histidine kinase [Paenibacillus sp. BC26]|uniref:sensor histidine kinase n=1 Tax=Paenibacillus sp. BC26 TaxID=1881032 RepID=UPI0008E360CC|nr:histidine kinase [Paenibacillus sp. BC26]SFT05818.1 two-component system, sensor histidine kinase YesM [Paenibacillus sp. BC26]
MKKRIHIKLFTRILLLYILVLSVALYIFTGYVSRNSYALLKEGQIGIHQQIIAALQNTMNDRTKTIKDILLKIYDDEQLFAYIMSMMDVTDQSESVPLDSYERKNMAYKLEDLLSLDPNINNLIFYNSHSQKAYLYMYDLDYAFFDHTEAILQNMPRLRDVSQESFIIPAHPGEYVASQASKNYFDVASNFYYPSSSLFLGRFIVEFGMDDLQYTINQFGKDMKGYLLVLTRDGEVVFDSSSTYYGRKYPYFEQLRQSSDSVMLAEDSIVRTASSDKDPFIYAAVLPKSALKKQLNIFNNSTYIAAIILLLFIFSVYFLVTSIISKRVNRIVKAMSKTVESNLAYRIPLNNKDNEFEQIAIHFNKMCDSLQDHINKSYVYELQQKIAEMKILENQINPHFLYNSLEAIRARLEIDGNDEGGEMIHSLAALFRASLKADSVVTLAEEIDLCNMYLKIFNARYQNFFHYEIEVEPSIMGYGIIKLILQPLIENYLIHGFDRKRQNNLLTIQGYRNENDLRITITDNGSGIGPEKLNEIRQKLTRPSQSSDRGSIGLYNVNERIKLLFGAAYGLEIESSELKGTTIIVRIPCRQPHEIKAAQLEIGNV